MKLFSLFFMLMFAVCVFAQPSMQLVDANEPILQDSLVTDSLSKISLTADIDTNDVVDMNKVERIDPAVDVTGYSAKNFFPDGFVVEIAYAAPTALHLSLFGGREEWNNGKSLERYSFFYGIPFASLDIDESMVSDEGILSLLLFICIMESSESVMETWLKLDYLLFGNTYFTLSENGRFGLFEKHRILDYAIYSLTTSGKSWEFGFSEAVGLRFVLLKNRRRSGYYIDLGVHVRITNQRFRYGVFVQLGGFGSSK